MQQTVSNHRTWLSKPPQISNHPASLITDNLEEQSKKKFEGIKDTISENAILVFGKRGCCMCHVVKRLLISLGVNPAFYEVIDDKDEISLIHELENRLSGDESRVINQFPCVYIGGKLFGGLDQLMGAHISGELVPILKKAGALWL